MGKYVKEKIENQEELRKQRELFYQFFLIALFFVTLSVIRIPLYRIFGLLTLIIRVAAFIFTIVCLIKLKKITKIIYSRGNSFFILYSLLLVGGFTIGVFWIIPLILIWVDSKKLLPAKNKLLTKPSSKPQPSLCETSKHMKNKSLIIPLITISLEIIMFFILVYYTFVGTLVEVIIEALIALPLSFVSLLCIIFSWNLLKKKRYVLPAKVFILISVLMITPIGQHFTALGFSKLLAPLAKRYNDWQYRLEDDDAKINMQHYKELLKEFRVPRKAIAVKEEYILLDDKKVIYLFGQPSSVFTQESILQNRIKCENDLRNLFINQGNLMQIRLPNFSDFNQKYPSWGSSCRFAEKQDKNQKFGDIPVLIYLNGELLNLRYAQDDCKKLLRKYQKRFK